MIKWTVLLLVLMVSNGLAAQTGSLPKGIGLYLYGYRHFTPMTQNYNADGDLEPLAKPLQKDFSGPKLLEGVGGAQLKELAKHIQKFDSYSEADNSLLNSLTLGELDGQVTGHINAQSLGFGFGITDALSAMILVPYVDATVTTDIQFSGSNNAQQIKQRLGAVAYKELQDGLDQATQITTNQIKQTIEKEGYAPIDQWSHTGIGDIVVGGVYGFNLRTGYRSLKSSTLIETTLSLPTGYVDDPNILTDVSIGKGYYSLGSKVRQEFTLRNRYIFTGIAGVGLNAPTKLQKRVPVDEEGIIAQDRLTTVDLTPGADFEFSGGAAIRFSSLRLGTTLGRKAHTKDTYSGSLEGNYDALARTSDRSQIYQEFSASFDTIEAYSKGKFVVPFILSGKYHMPLAAKNTIDERYFEVSIASFFSTPMAAPESKFKHKKKRAYLNEELSYNKATRLKKNKRHGKRGRTMTGHHH